MSTERRDLELTVWVKGRPITNRVVRPGEDILPDYPLRVAARKQDGSFYVLGPAGEEIVVAPGSDAGADHRFARGEITVEASTVRRFRLTRWIFEQGHIVLPLLFLLVSLFVAQVQLFLSMFSGGPAGAAAPEPSPEMIARLLDERFEGAERGVYAIPAERPPSENKVESFYLQPGTDGPTKRMGGGKDVAKEQRDGTPGVKKKKAAKAPPPVQPVGETERPPQPEAVVEAVEPAPEEEDGEDEEPAVEITEGWGLTDWYDSEDARKDAQKMKRELEYARQLLRIDPNDTYALSIRAYYEYLSMDMGKARRTYEKMLSVEKESAATWNNLALVYKREKDYVKEEELYRVSLEYGPDDPNTLNNLAVNLARQGRHDEATAIMKKLERVLPDDPYADLHRAKIYAMMGKEELSYRYLRESLAEMRKLDTLHNIEYQQDIRVDPAFDEMRKTDRFRNLLKRYYGKKKGGWWMLPGTP